MIKKIKKRILQEVSYASGKYKISPEIASLVITYACNFKCQACSVWRMDKYPELSISQWVEICKNLKQTLAPSTTIELSGGELLLRKELTLLIIKDLSDYFNNIGINSNGSLLDEETVLDLKNAGVNYVKLSLYDIENNTHDKLRGYKSAGEKVKKAIEILQKHRVKTDIGILITTKNIRNIPKLINFYQQKDYSYINLILQPLDEPIGENPISGKNKKETINHLWPDTKSVKEFFTWLENNNISNIKNSKASLKVIEKYYLDQKSALARRCFAGQRNLVIYPDGKVSLCYKGSTIGNIAKENLFSILSGKKACQERLEFKKCPKHCRIIGCNFQKTIPETLKIMQDL